MKKIILFLGSLVILIGLTQTLKAFTIISLNGSAKVTRQRGYDEGLKPGMKIYQGDTVIVHKNSNAVLQGDSKSIINLSQLSISHFPYLNNSRKFIYIEKGSVAAQLCKQIGVGITIGSHEITAEAEYISRSTSFVLAASQSAKQSNYLEVKHGTVHLSNSHNFSHWTVSNNQTNNPQFYMPIRKKDQNPKKSNKTLYKTYLDIDTTKQLQVYRPGKKLSPAFHLNIYPVKGKILSEVGMRKAIFGDKTTYEFHPGIDIRANKGMPVKAVRSGKVILARSVVGYGNVVFIDHGDGLETRYAHLSKILVEPGDIIDSEATVGEVGSTGKSTGPHLHFEVRQYGKPQKIAFN